MKFKPSEHSEDYGWIYSYPLHRLTVSATADRKGLDNTPASSEHEKNLSKLSDFLGKLPFQFTITSGYRSPTVNTAVGGSKTSQHPNGLATDAVPIGVSNRQVAAWLYAYQSLFPELDQVIWYSDTNHVHIGICPSGATGCRSNAPRRQFLKARKEGSSYATFLPEAGEAQAMAQMFPYSKAKSLAKTYLLAPETWAVVGVVLAATLTTAYWVKRGVRKRKG